MLEQPLVVIVATLLIGILVSLAVRRDRMKALRVVILFTSLFALFFAMFGWIGFNRMEGFQYLFRLDLFSQYNLVFSFGADGLSMVFLLLTLFVMPICILASWMLGVEAKKFLVYLLSIELLLVLTFTTTDLFYFYVFFESLLLPMFILIGRWGSRERKIKAAYYFFLYTLFGSLFMLFGIFYLYFIVGSTHFFVLFDADLAVDQQKVVWVCFFMAFAVKMPLFPFHIWLPEAHVEAPTIGSIILASLLLKLGGYGFLRFSLVLLADASQYFTPVIYVFSLLGVIYASLSTIRQIDLKRVIAYSSVAHMNLVMLGLFSYEHQSIDGAIYLMVGHGVVSSALFFIVGVLYDRYHTRLIRYYGGLVTPMPIFASFFLFFTLANMSLPGTSNFLGEFFIFAGLFSSNTFALLGATTSIVLSAVYSIWLFNRIVFGTIKNPYFNKYRLLFKDVNKREFVVLVCFFVPTVLLGLRADFILNMTYPSVQLIEAAATNHIF